MCCDRNKDPNYIIAVVNVLEDSDLPSRSLKLGTFEVFYILKNLTFKVFEVHCVCVCFLMDFERFNFCAVHVSSIFDSDCIGPGVFARRLRGTKGRSGNFVLWRKNMLARDGAGWMSIRREFNIVRVQDTMIIMTTMNMFEVFACFKFSIQDVLVS